MSKPAPPTLPASVVMALGLGGCGLFGPCLSTRACLSMVMDTDCDTGDSGDTGCEETADTADSQAADVEQASEEAAEALRAAGGLPEDVAARLGVRPSADHP